MTTPKYKVGVEPTRQIKRVVFCLLSRRRRQAFLKTSPLKNKRNKICFFPMRTKIRFILFLIGGVRVQPTKSDREVAFEWFILFWNMNLGDLNKSKVSERTMEQTCLLARLSKTSITMSFKQTEVHKSILNHFLNSAKLMQYFCVV